MIRLNLDAWLADVGQSAYGWPESLRFTYDKTRELLLEASRDRDEAKLRRASIRIDGERFSALSDERQEELLMLYAAAMSATGALAP